jgi:gluconolactonase
VHVGSTPRIELYAAAIGRCEGPLIRQSGTLVVCSINHGCLYEIVDGEARVFADTAGGPSGLTEGADGTLYVAQQGNYGHAKQDPRIWGGIQAVDRDGAVSWLSQDPYCPNDLCHGPDGLLYVTDPSRRPWEDGRLWRIDPTTGDAELLTSVAYYPNGIGFGPADGSLFVASTSHGQMLRYPFAAGGPLGEPEVFAKMPRGVPDGFAFDVEGNLIVCAVRLDDQASELQAFDPNGDLVDTLRLGRRSFYTNVAINADGTAYVTDTQGESVLEVTGWTRPGLPLHPFRR